MADETKTHLQFINLGEYYVRRNTIVRARLGVNMITVICTNEHQYQIDKIKFPVAYAEFVHYVQTAQECAPAEQQNQQNKRKPPPDYA
jgi:hypothetical protein